MTGKRQRRVIARIDARGAALRAGPQPLSEDEIERRTQLLESVERWCSPHRLRIVAMRWGLTTGVEMTQQAVGDAFDIRAAAVAIHERGVRERLAALKEAGING